MSTETIWNAAGSLLLILALVAVALGIGTCTQRNWQFEDACRRAGGVVMDAAKVSAASNGYRDICAKVVQPPIADPIALPNYRNR